VYGLGMGLRLHAAKVEPGAGRVNVAGVSRAERLTSLGDCGGIA
jgi:hypothetical protein